VAKSVSSAVFNNSDFSLENSLALPSIRKLLRIYLFSAAVFIALSLDAKAASKPHPAYWIGICKMRLDNLANTHQLL